MVFVQKSNSINTENQHRVDWFCFCDIKAFRLFRIFPVLLFLFRLFPLIIVDDLLIIKFNVHSIMDFVIT